MKRKCCCGCDIVWQDSFSSDHLSSYDKTGSWSRVSNRLRCSADNSRIIHPGSGVTFFSIDYATALGSSDKIKLYIRWVDSSNHIYGYLKNGSDVEVEIHSVVAGVDTLLMRNAYDNDSGPVGIFGSGQLAISDRAGVVSFCANSSYNGLYSQQYGVGYNYSGNLTVSVYLPGSPAKCGFECEDIASAIDFDNWDSRKGKQDIPYGEATDCKRLLSACNMVWQEPQLYTCLEWYVDFTEFATANNPEPGFGCSSCEANNPFTDIIELRSWPIYEDYLAVADPDCNYFVVETPCLWTNYADPTMCDVMCGHGENGLTKISAGYFDSNYRLLLESHYAGDYVHYWSDPLPLDARDPILFTRDPAWGGYNRCLNTWPDTVWAGVIE